MLKYNLKDLTKAYENGIVNKAYDGSKLVYQRLEKEEEPTKNYLAFTALEDGTFAFGNNINYSLDNGKTWTELAANTSTPTIASGSKIMWKAELTPNNNGIGGFSSTGRFDAEGDILSLHYGDDFEGKIMKNGRYLKPFYGLFSHSKIVSAKNLTLPSHTARSCYDHMFYECTSLEKAPELPAKTLSISCYLWMFAGCTSLEKAPELLASRLTDYCYNSMFSGCINLNYVKCLLNSSTSGSYYSTSGWLNHVAASGTFVKKSGVEWSRGNGGIPEGWTVEEE